MIDRIKKIYPKHVIYEKRNDKLYDSNGKLVSKSENLNKKSYVILNSDSYEVYSKKKRNQNSTNFDLTIEYNTLEEK